MYYTSTGWITIVHKIAKIAIITNVILGLLFIVSNFVFDYFGNMPSHHVLWSPLWLHFYNYVTAAQIGDFGVQEPNFSFYFFWASIAVNLYFILRMSKEAKAKQVMGFLTLFLERYGKWLNMLVIK